MEYLEGTNEPLSVDTEGESAVREDLPFVERNAVSVILKHWSEEKYAGLKWKKVDWDTFITGGIEEGQTPEEAGKAEILEETGYLHPVLVRRLTNTHAKFYHPPKGENRYAHFAVLYFELQDGEQAPVSEDEQKKHELVWLTREEMESFRLPAGHRFSWEELVSTS